MTLVGAHERFWRLRVRATDEQIQRGRDILAVALARRNGYPYTESETATKCLQWLDNAQRLDWRLDVREEALEVAVAWGYALLTWMSRYSTKEGVREFICTQEQLDAIATCGLTDASKIQARKWAHVAPLD